MLDEILSGYKKRVATLKLKGEMAVFEGKHPLSFMGYSLLASKILKIEPMIVRNSSVDQAQSI